MKGHGKSGRQKHMIKIGNKEIGGNATKNYTYVVLEAGVNHNGSLERAKSLIKRAAQAGADAIKFQTYTADELVVKGTPKFWNAESKVDEGLNQHEAYKALEGFKDEWYPELIKECESYGIEFLSTPFSFKAADFLNNLGMKAFKIASSDMSTIPFLKHIARFGKPILLSTGASTLDEIKESVRAIREEGNNQIVVMHCTLSYPTRIEDANLDVIKTLQAEFPDLVIGLSDHTLGITGSIIASAMGAGMVEKHFTVDKGLDKSADHWLSIDPKEAKIMVDAIREVEVFRGSAEKQILLCESETRKLDKRSIVSRVTIEKGDTITEDMITYKRPGTGIWPFWSEKVIGSIALEDIPEDTILDWKMIKKQHKQYDATC